MQCVIIESPYAGNLEANVAYAINAMRDSLQRGEAPFASHILYAATGVLDDGNLGERTLGINAGFAWANNCHFAAFYVDLGWSRGMLQAKARYDELGIPYIERSLLPPVEQLS